MTSLPHVTSVEPLDGYRLRLTFDDGVVGVVDLSEELWGPMFEPLRDPTVFAQVRVDVEMGTVVWPNGADLDPCTLHAEVAASSPTRSAG
jgi:hypothetical protein